MLRGLCVQRSCVARHSPQVDKHASARAQTQGSGVKKLVAIPFRLVYAFYREILVTFSGGSVFLDSPLNEDGVAQVVPRLRPRFCALCTALALCVGDCVSGERAFSQIRTCKPRT